MRLQQTFVPSAVRKLMWAVWVGNLFTRTSLCFGDWNLARCCSRWCNCCCVLAT